MMVPSHNYAAVLAASASLSGGIFQRASLTTNGISLDVNDPASIKQAASTVVYNLLKTYYVGNVTLSEEGLVPSPYSWWQGGALFGGLIDYWAYTGDNSYTNETAQAILSQEAPTVDFVMPNEHSGMGNDDEGFWALAAMSALEEGLPVPDGYPEDIWQQLTINVFNDYVSRWKIDYCNGGLRWQVWPDNRGYDYKNTIANICFSQLAARLARYTGNSTYARWADTSFSWLEGVGLLDTTTWMLADGAHVESNCTDINRAYFSYNPALAVYTAAVMYNITSSSIWEDRMFGILNSTAKHFFSPYPNATDIVFEAQCETTDTCDTDQFSFKAFVSRWFAKSALIVPQLTPLIQPLLAASALAAAESCSGEGNHTCGTKWYVGGYDGHRGMGQYMSAYETFQSLLVFTGDAPQPGTAADASSTVGSEG